MLQILFLISSGALLILGYLHGRLRASHREVLRAQAALQGQSGERVARLAAINRQAEAQAAEIDALRAQLAEALRERETLRVERQAHANREAALTDLQAQIEALRAERDAQASAAQQADREVEALKATLHAKADELDYKLALTLTLANTAYDGLLVIDQHCRIIASNTSAEHLFGDAQPAGKRLSDVTGNTWLEMMVENALANEEAHYEEQLNIGDRPHRVRAEVIHRHGNTFIGLALQDVSELIRLNRARRDMVANISHELRTPIANIRLIIDGLFHDQDKPKRKDSITSLRAIARETDNLLWLVQEMADLSMIESGQSIVRMVEVPLPEIVAEAVERLTDQTASKKQQIVQQVPDHLRVLCDRDLIQRVVVNLLHNALKWSPDDEVIRIEAESLGEEVKISVLDNGPGVPDDQVERIFERFYQVDASRSGHEGTGLGLAICRHIVEAHGGRVWAEGNHGRTQGGRFMFTLLNSDLDAVEAEMIPRDYSHEIQ
jgi:two-component system phosphate regulon sensor histidine kinase PhoR